MIRTAFEQGRDRALERYGVKIAVGRVMPPMGAPIAAAHMPPPAPPPAPVAPPVAPGAQQFMHPLTRGLGLAAVGAAGAAAYGMHHQNQRDREGQNLVYAPMQGAY